MSILATAYSGRNSTMSLLNVLCTFELGKHKKYGTKWLKLPKLLRNLVALSNVPLSRALLVDVM